MCDPASPDEPGLLILALKDIVIVSLSEDEDDGHAAAERPALVDDEGDAQLVVDESVVVLMTVNGFLLTVSAAHRVHLRSSHDTLFGLVAVVVGDSQRNDLL